MIALCTGGCGFVGSHVVGELLRRGWEVVVVDDLSTGSVDNVFGLGADLELCDITTLEEGEVIADANPDAIFHLAAQTDVATSVRDPRSDAETNVLGTLNVLRAAEAVGARVVFASTGGAVYGECERPAVEDDPPRPASPYAMSKLAAEGYVLGWNRLTGSEHIVLRYANVYGPRQLATLEGGVVAAFLDARARDAEATIFGDGSQTRDFVHVGDVAEATVRAVDLDAGVYNVGTGRETSVLNLAGMLELRCTFEAARRGDLRRSVVDPSKLRAALGRWEPLALEDGLAAMQASA